MEKEKEVESFFTAQRNRYFQLILLQRAGIQHIVVEPTFLWVHHFPSKQYTTLIEQEIDICQILQTIDAAVSYSDIIPHTKFRNIMIQCSMKNCI
jgi:hypothetical protein